MTVSPWRQYPIDLEHFTHPPREYGIWPFWFLNGRLEPAEMRYQISEYRHKGMPGMILHGRYGLEMPYIGETYLERIRLAVEEAQREGMQTWIYDEMNWPSGTADKRVLQARPDLAQRYLECVNFTVRGPWFTYLTGADSRYNDFERSTPVAAYAVGQDGQVIDLTPYLSFTDVIPWEAPAGNWRLLYFVEKIADYYIDALNPEATAEFLRLGYAPYIDTLGEELTRQVHGFYTDEPAMHYYLTGGDNPIVPWTKDMFRRFQGRNGYNLRACLPHLFFDLGADTARIRYDFYCTLTEFYSQAFYRQIHEWCQPRGLLFTGHLLYEEWMRRLIRVEGNLFRHYEHMDVIGVDHLYPIIGNADRPDEHVAMKVGSSAAHLLGSQRLLCESFGGIFMDATMQRMKWIADWEYVLGVNLLNPHGFHYTLEGPRKRDWPPSMFYQYPWWRYYGEFSSYISRLSHMLSGGRHVAKVAVLWPIYAMFAGYTPQAHNSLGDRTEYDFNALTDLLLRLHYDFDYLEEELFARAEIREGKICLGEEAYELLILPPLTHIALSTLEQMERLTVQGGRLLGCIILPDQAFTPGAQRPGSVDIAGRVQVLFGIDPAETQQNYTGETGITAEMTAPGTAFVRSYALARQLPFAWQQCLGQPGRTESASFVIEAENEVSRYYVKTTTGERIEITAEVEAERLEVRRVLADALAALIDPDVTIDRPEVFYLHRVKDGRDIYFFINPTFAAAPARVSISGEYQPLCWDPSSGEEKPLVPYSIESGRTVFQLPLAAVGSAFVVTRPAEAVSLFASNLHFDALDLQAGKIEGYGRTAEGWIEMERQAALQKNTASNGGGLLDELLLDGEWDFTAEGDNALVIGAWLAAMEPPGSDDELYARPGLEESDWAKMVPGAWSYQLAAEPERSYPLPVWYRTRFSVAHVPDKLHLIVDGFAGSEWQVFVNGQAVRAQPVRSAIDSQMLELDIQGYLQEGENLVAIRIVLTGATDGLLDLLKLVGNFSLAPGDDGTPVMVAPLSKMPAESWTLHGYPYYSGTGVYSRTITLPETRTEQRLFLQAELAEDVLEVLVNGQPAGVRLWPPYEVEITPWMKPGGNLLALRVANTLVNLLEGTPRPSGLTAPPRLVAYPTFHFELS
jgi:hypothetical protein